MKQIDKFKNILLEAGSIAQKVLLQMHRKKKF